MPKRESAPLGAPCWIELFTSDPSKSRSFYGGLFGWTAEDAGAEFGGYITFHKDASKVAGCMRSDGSTGVADQWSLYLATDDAKATEESAAANGAQVIVPAMEVMDLGSMVVLADVGHASVGGWQAGVHKGFELIAEPGAPAWFELHTRDYEASIEFYRTVFGWDTHVASDSPEFRYTTFGRDGEGDGPLAGVMDAGSYLPEGLPAQWWIYFAVEDTDATLTKVADLGGTVVIPAEDTPFGRLATVADTTGAQFRVVAEG